MRIQIIVCLLLLTSGCTAILTGQKQAKLESDSFQSALEQLLQDNNAKAMNTYIKNNPDSQNVDSAKRLLELHDSAKNNQGKLIKCSQQLEATQQEMSKLQEDIERLTQLNLEMDRSSP